ncbi:MAG: hypothetical protein ACRC62_05885 [Microcoleus sp.]
MVIVNYQLSTINRERAGTLALQLSTMRAGTGAPPLPTINRERAPDARTTTINRERAPDARTTTINYQLSTLSSRAIAFDATEYPRY